MAQKITNDEGVEVEVYTAEEVQAQIATATKAKEDEFGKTKAQIESERDEARKILGERNTEVKNFRRLSDEQVAKLTAAERTIYENGVVLEEERKKRSELETRQMNSAIDAAIIAKAGTDKKLFDKMKEVWAVIGIEAITPEQIENKAKMVLGAIGLSEPDLVASVQGFNGGYQPPVAKKQGEASFADTDKGKAGAAELGLVVEAPKK